MSPTQTFVCRITGARLHGIFLDSSGLSLRDGGLGISPGYYERLLRLLSKENKGKIEPKEIHSCLIPCLLVVFTRQLEILVTTLTVEKSNYCHVLKAQLFSAQG